MRMNMSDFATFFAVARNQSFRAAGDELGLSSSAISHSIKTLEQRLKIRLFNRTTRSVSLTEAGSNLYERLRPAFDEIQIMLDEMNDFRLTPTGTLKINAARVAARIFLMPLLRKTVLLAKGMEVPVSGLRYRAIFWDIWEHISY